MTKRMPRHSVRSATASAAAVLLLAASFAVGSSVIPALEAEPAAAAGTMDCDMLAVGQPCSFDYADHAGKTTVTIPDSVDFITVVLNGASGGGSVDGQGTPGPGGSTVGVIDVRLSFDRQLWVWLGQDGNGLDGESDGWSHGGRGGIASNDGGAGGGSSAITYAVQSDANPLMIAGGGGGGGAEAAAYSNNGGRGGAGGTPAQDGTRGLSPAGSAWGAGGRGGHASHSHGTAGGDYHGDLGAGGGGGGGGFTGGTGGENGELTLRQTEGSGGGGGGGTSYLDDELHQQIGFGLAPMGHGSVTIYAGQPLDRFECTDTHDPTTIDIPAGVSSYGFVLMGGAGTHGHNVGPEGTGAFATGVLDVSGLTQLNYWVGCSGYHHGGAGFGHPGAGGDAPADGNDGGGGGGASALATTDGQMLVVAGGGGGTGGDEGDCDSYPMNTCGGAGGSGGGSSHSRTPAHGQEGGDGLSGGGDGGCSNCHHENGHLSINGGHGVAPPDHEFATGGGGGGGAGYPAGGAGGHHDFTAPGGGGGAGGSYLAKSRVEQGTLAPSGHFGSGFVILIPIVEATTDLTVEVTATGPAADYAAAPFQIAVHCELGGRTSVQRTVSLMAGQSHVFSDVPQHSACTVTETGTGGASTPAPPQQLTLGSEPETVTMANEFAAGDLALGVTSAVVNASQEPVSGVGITLGDLRLVIQCLIAEHPIALPAGGLVTVPGQDTWGAGWTGSIDNLPVGAECAIQETVNGGATTVQYTVDGGAPQPEPATVIAATGSALAAINHFATGSLEVAKSADGDGTPPAGATYGGTLTCTFDGAPVVFTPSLADFALEVGGSTTYSSIPIGADCTVTETDQGLAHVASYLPSGTVRVDADPEVDVDVRNTFQSGSLHVQVGRAGEGSHWPNGGYTVQVSCTDGTVDEFTTGPDGGWRGYTPDAGATCTITETADGGATTVSSVTSADPTPVTGPVDVVIPGTGSASVTITNTFQAARLYLDVVNTGPGASYSDGAIVHVEKCEFDGIPFAIAPGNQWNFIPGHAGGIGGSPLLPVGAQCEVRMGDDAGGVPTMTPVNVEPSTVIDPAILQVTINDELLNGPSVVEIDIAFALAALEVTVTNEGPGAAFANVPFEVEVNCQLDDDPLHGPGGHVTLHFAPDGSLLPDSQSAQLEALPVGAGCAAVETVQGGAVEWGTNPPATTVDSDGATLAVTNVFATSELTVTKLIDGVDADAHAGDEFVFDAACTFNGLPIPPSAELPVTFHLSPNGARVFTLPAGAECTITETHDEHATTVSPGPVQPVSIVYGNDAALTFTNTFDVDDVTIRQVVSGAGAGTYGMDVAYLPDLDCRWPSDGEPITLPDNGKVELDEDNAFTAVVTVPVGAICGAQEPSGLASAIISPAPITVALGGEFELVLEAVYDLGELSVLKDARGTVSAGLEYGFDTWCTYPVDDSTVEIPLNGFAPGQYELADGEAIMLQVLHGATCTTTEVASHDPLRVAVEASGFEATVSGSSAVNVILAGTPSGVVVTNFFTGSLPLTGSELSVVALWVGVAVLGVGLALVLVRFVRRRHLG